MGTESTPQRKEERSAVSGKSNRIEYGSTSVPTIENNTNINNKDSH